MLRDVLVTLNIIIPFLYGVQVLSGQPKSLNGVIKIEKVSPRHQIRDGTEVGE